MEAEREPPISEHLTPVLGDTSSRAAVPRAGPCRVLHTRERGPKLTAEWG